MAFKLEHPLLLLDNSNMNTLFNEGEFKCTNMTFEEAREIIGMYEKDEIVLCFTHPDTYDIIFNYLEYQIRTLNINKSAICELIRMV